MPAAESRACLVWWSHTGPMHCLHRSPDRVHTLLVMAELESNTNPGSQSCTSIVITTQGFPSSCAAPYSPSQASFTNGTPGLHTVTVKRAGLLRVPSPLVALQVTSVSPTGKTALKPSDE